MDAAEEVKKIEEETDEDSWSDNEGNAKKKVLEVQSREVLNFIHNE